MTSGPSIRDLLHVIDTLHLDQRSPELATVRTLIRLGRIDEDQARSIRLAIQDFVNQQQKRPNFLQSPSEEDLYEGVPPDITLGAAADTGARFGLHLRNGVKHVLVCGGTGAGKTTLLRNIVFGTHEFSKSHGNLISQIIVDKKYDFLDVPQRFGEDWILLDFYRGLHIGLNPPTGVPVQAWINRIASSFALRAGLVAARTCLAHLIRWLVRVMNPKPTDRPFWPSFQLILDVAQASDSRLWTQKSEYLKSLTQYLEDVVENTGNVFDTFRGIDLVHEVLGRRKHVIIGCKNVEPVWIRQFMIDTLCLQILYSRFFLHQKTDHTQVVLYVDEGDEEFSRAAESALRGGLTPLALWFKQGREYGCMGVASVSVIDTISRFVLSNANNLYVMTQPDAETIVASQRCLQLSATEKAMLPSLREGECIVRQAQSAYPHPFMGKIDYIAPHRGGLPRFDTHGYVPGRRLAELPHVQQALNDLQDRRSKSHFCGARRRPAELAEHEISLIDAAIDAPYTPAVRLWERLGKFLPEIQRKTYQRLTDAKLIAKKDFRIGKSNYTLIDILEKGYTLRGRTAPKLTGRGGIEHRHVAHWIAEVGRRRNFEAKLEWVVPGTSHPVDVVWKREGETHVFEVSVTATDNIVAHLVACFVDSDVVDTVTIVAATKNKLNEIKAQVVSEPTLTAYAGRIQTEVVSTYMKELWP